MGEYAVDVLGEEVVNGIMVLLNDNYKLKYDFTYNCEGDGYLKDVIVSIVTMDYSNETETEIGYIKINILSKMFLLNYDEAYEYADIISQTFVDGFLALFKDMTMRGKRYDFDELDDFIYIDEFKIHKQFRGNGIGSAVIREVIDFIYKRGSVLAIIPFAIEDIVNDKAHNRVRKFWRKLGFKRFNNSRYYVYNV